MKIPQNFVDKRVLPMYNLTSVVSLKT